MRREDFLAVVESSPGLAEALRNMGRKRYLKKAVKQLALAKNRGLSDEDIVAAFHEADMDKSGYLNVNEVQNIMHQMDLQSVLGKPRYMGEIAIAISHFKRFFSYLVFYAAIRYFLLALCRPL